MTLKLDDSYGQLPGRFYTRVPPQHRPNAQVLRLNTALAAALGFDENAVLVPEVVQKLAGSGGVSGDVQPLAMVYAGHQFGNWVPRLGDGRAALLGDVLASDGQRYDIHLKGSGITEYSRGGDGNAVLGAVLREYIVSEAMFALGIPTSRALAVISTGQEVRRETLEPGAVLVRVARSHIRVGTFQYFYAQEDIDGLRMLLEFAIKRHDPDLEEAEQPALSFLERVAARQANLIAQWMGVGFIHGVMNTDNMTVSGETIDYGPCAFMDDFKAAKVFSSIDLQGRYAWGNQPASAHWNLAQLAQALVPLIAPDPRKAAQQAQSVLDTFPEMFRAQSDAVLGAKLGIRNAGAKDQPLSAGFLRLLEKEGLDYTRSFRQLTAGQQTGAFQEFRDALTDKPAFDKWFDTWQARIKDQSAGAAADIMAAVNPVYIPRNHRIEQVIKAAYQGDLAPFEELLVVLKTPFTANPDHRAYEDAPKTDEVVQQTFCGT